MLVVFFPTLVLEWKPRNGKRNCLLVTGQTLAAFKQLSYNNSSLPVVQSQRVTVTDFCYHTAAAAAAAVESTVTPATKQDITCILILKRFHTKINMNI